MALDGEASPRWLVEHAHRSPDGLALLSVDQDPLSFAGLHALVERVAGELRALGVARNDRVATLLSGGPATATTSLAISAAATCAPLNPDYTESELDFFLHALHPRLLLTSPEREDVARAAARRAGIPVVRVEVPERARAGELRLRPLVDREAGGEGEVPGHEAGRGSPDGPAELDDVAFLLHTSGSTARPKLVPLTHRNVLASARNVVRSLALTAEDRCLSMLPLFHVGALVDLLVAPLSVGGQVAIAPDLSSARFFEMLDRFAPSWYQGVPTMLRDLVSHARLHHREGRSSSLRLIRSVSAALPAVVMEEVEEALAAPVIEIYGMTETAGLITSNPLPPGERRVGSVGLAAGPELSIVDEAGNAVGPEQRGEVVVRGANVMSGYEGEAESRAFVGDWLRTGDEGLFDRDGYLTLTGRIKEIINRGGEKISPREIDEVCAGHPAVREAAAFALPHESLGEEVGLAVVPREAGTLDEQALTRFLAERLAYYKVPRTIFVCDELPRGGSGKLQRHRLSESLGGLAGAEGRPEWEPPATPTEERIAKLWERALEVPGVGRFDDFFDLGGDSLKAASFIGELQEGDGPAIEVSTLFDAPTVAGFAARLDEMSTGLALDDVPTITPDGIRPDLYRDLVSYLSAWRGRRQTSQSLLVGRNTLGTRTPLFWGLQAFHEFELLAAHLDPDRPVYAFRSLYKLEQKSEASNAELARFYATEIEQLQPTGPIIVGGFCEAGKIAFEIACVLERNGREVALLGLQEQFVPADYAGRVAFFFCRPGKHSPYLRFQRPELGWSKFYTGEVSLYSSKDSHDDYYAERGIADFTSQLEDAIDAALRGETRSPLRLEPGLQRLPEEAYRARLTATLPRFMARGERRVLEVEVENRSPVRWLPTEESGIVLGNRWLGVKGRYKVGQDGCSPLPEALEPGETCRIRHEIQAPARGRRWTLELDLVDEGVAWFGDEGSEPARFPMRAAKHAAFWNRLTRGWGREA